MTTFLSYKQAAELLGHKVTTLRTKVRRLEIPHVRLGPRLVVFERQVLLDLLARSRAGGEGHAPATPATSIAPAPKLGVDIQAVRSRLASSREENARLALACGRLLGVDWAAGAADGDELADLVDGGVELPDFGDSWAALRDSVPSLHEFMAEAEKEDPDVVRYLRHHPEPLLDGFMAGAREVSKAVDQEGA